MSYTCLKFSSVLRLTSYECSYDYVIIRNILHIFLSFGKKAESQLLSADSSCVMQHAGWDTIRNTYTYIIYRVFKNDNVDEINIT